MEERRRVPRHVVLKSAKIVYNHQSPLIDCIVCDLTNDGACLRFAATMPPPDSFALSFDNFRSTRACRVAWRQTDRLGVGFSEMRTEHLIIVRNRHGSETGKL